MLRRITLPRRVGVLLCIVLLAVLLALAATLAIVVTPPVSADGGAPNLAYIAGGGQNGDGLVIIDVSKGQVVQRVGLGAAPAAVLLSTDNRSAFVALPSANQIAVVDTSSHTVGTPLDAGPGPRSMALGFV